MARPAAPGRHERIPAEIGSFRRNEGQRGIAVDGDASIRHEDRDSRPADVAFDSERALDVVEARSKTLVPSSLRETCRSDGRGGYAPVDWRQQFLNIPEGIWKPACIGADLFAVDDQANSGLVPPEECTQSARMLTLPPT